MASAHGYTRSLRLVERRAPAPLALPAPPGHVPQPLPPALAPRRSRGGALPTLWALLGASLVGFLSATALLDNEAAPPGDFVHAVPLGGVEREPAADSSLRVLSRGLARLIIPAAPPPPPRANLPPDVRETALGAPVVPDDTAASIAGLVATLNAPVIDVGPFGEPLPAPPPAPATATWTGAIGMGQVVAALPSVTAAMPTVPEPGDEPEDEEPALALPGSVPQPPPAAPRARPAAPRLPEPRAPRIVARQDAPAAPGSGARIVHPPPAPRTASVGATIPLPPLPEARNVSVARPVPPPDGFAAQSAAATVPAAGAAWMRFARPFDRNDIRPRIAIVVVDLGLTPAPTDQAIHYLPGTITLAFSPFADGLTRWVDLARRAGHEVLMHLPLESPTSAAATVAGGPSQAEPTPGAENLGRLDWALGRATGYVGVASFMGAAASEPALRPILTSLRDRGVLYVDRQGGPRTPSARLAGELGLPRASVDREIDADPTREAIDQRLAELEKLARDTGTAVAIVRPLALSFERLSIWSTTLEAKGIALAPITAVLNRQRNR
ncbi:MAG: divergent polysaccharide deacetylase family protein [Alphaproteobacteria bacterium]|nr:divergent polysaccharide deacetylase family protein [Alphaproteobacteria bacterium]